MAEDICGASIMIRKADAAGLAGRLGGIEYSDQISGFSPSELRQANKALTEYIPSGPSTVPYGMTTFCVGKQVTSDSILSLMRSLQSVSPPIMTPTDEFDPFAPIYPKPPSDLEVTLPDATGRGRIKISLGFHRLLGGGYYVYLNTKQKFGL